VTRRPPTNVAEPKSPPLVPEWLAGFVQFEQDTPLLSFDLQRHSRAFCCHFNGILKITDFGVRRRKRP